MAEHELEALDLRVWDAGGGALAGEGEGAEDEGLFADVEFLGLGDVGEDYPGDDHHFDFLHAV